MTEPGNSDDGGGYCSSFALGWNVAELDRLLRTPSADPEVAPTLLDERLSRDEQLGQITTRITARLSKLRGALTVEQLQADLDEVIEVLSAGSAPQALQDRLRAYHTGFSNALLAEDSRLGKAYRLGIALNQLSSEPDDGPAARWDDEQRVARATRYLADLQSVLPAHAAMGVSMSLQLWRQHANGKSWNAVKETLPQQGRIWRALLSGEKPALHSLKPWHYVEAGKRALQDAVGTVRSLWATRSLAVALGAVIVVGLAGLVLLGAALADGVADGGAAAAGGGGMVTVAAVVTTFAWKRVKAADRAWETVRLALMGAALDVVVAVAITELPVPVDNARLVTQARDRLVPTGFVPTDRR